MKQWKIVLGLFLGVALLTTGCAKKNNEQASISGTGFDSSSTADELAQLPQASATGQTSSVEALPIEAAPVTQAVPTAMTVASDIASLSRDQQIQTALKNAGLYNGKIDGKLGPASKKAIEAFQASKGLKADGKVGPKTWAALQEYLTGVPSDVTAQDPSMSGNQ